MKTILVVEDDLAIARGLSDNLRREGYRVLVENDGLEGYERAGVEQPDLVILDVMLPTMDGFQICSLLKDQDFAGPIFLLTGLTQERSRLEGLGTGADDYIEKPFNLEELLLRIRNALKRRETAQGRANLLESEFLKARKIQMASLPRRHPRRPGLDVYGRTQPASQVGGDYFDYLKIGTGKLGIIVADVSGKGLPAAMYVQKIQGIVQSNVNHSHGPDHLLKVLQEHMRDSMESRSFVTAVVGYFDPVARCLDLAQAGHLPVFLVRHRRIRLLKPKGVWIGRASARVFEKSLRVQSIQLQRGDVVLFYSDGLVEARDSRSVEFGPSRLRKSIIAGHAREAKGIVEHCFNSVRKFCAHQAQCDDITVVAVRIIPHQQNSKETVR